MFYTHEPGKEKNELFGLKIQTRALEVNEIFLFL